MKWTRLFRGARPTRGARARSAAPSWTLDDVAGSADYDVVFATLREYQLREIGVVSRELRARGLRSAWVGSGAAPDARTARAADEASLDLVPIERYVAGYAKPRVLVVRSEVDDVIRGLVEHANRVGVATAALAHPVINFTRYPDPYTTSSTVLCAGRFTAARMRRTGLVITGFPGFDEYVTRERGTPESKRVLVNLSLQRGLGPKGVVLEDVRLRWMTEVRTACDAVGASFVVSRHPSDVGATYDWPVDPRSVYDLLPGAWVVISPPSTVLLEALAMGIPGVCHRDEAIAPFEMDTFDEPRGAFCNTTGVRPLVEALRAEWDQLAPPRARFRTFLDEHLALDSDRSATERIADALVGLRASTRP